MAIGLVLAAAGGLAIVAATDDDPSPAEQEPGAGLAESELEPVPGPAGGLKRAGGVTYPDDDPPAFVGRPRSPSCGREGVAQPESGKGFVETRPVPVARLCLLEAWASASEAELTTTFPTVEGPALVILRVLSDGSVERYELDSFGRGPIVQRCEALKADGEVIPPGGPAPAESPSRLDAINCDRPRELL